MADLELARAFFRRFLKSDLLSALDLEDLADAKETFVGSNLDELITDLLYTAPFRDRPSFISLLVEHKSQGALRKDEDLLPFQMRRQEIKIMDHGRRNNLKKLYPLVLMVGLYHGKKPYAGPMSVAEKIDAPDRFIPQRWKEEMTRIDLSRYTDSDLLSGGKLGVFLLILKHIYNRDMLITLDKLIPIMQEIEDLKNGADFLVTVFQYLYDASRIENQQGIDKIALQSFSSETGAKVMTIAEQIRKEAKEQIALNLIGDGLDVHTVVRYTGLPPEDVARLQNERRSGD